MDSQKAWRCEILLDNIIEKDFQAALLPLNLVQLIFFLPKYFIRDNFITPHGTIANLLICFGGIVICIVNIYRLIDSFSVLDFSLFLFMSKVFDVVSYAFGNFLNIFVTIYYSVCCVEMLLKLHKSYRLLSSDNKLFKKFLYWNWFHVVSLITFYVLLVFYWYTAVNQFSVPDVLSICLVFIFDFNLLFGSRVLKIIRLDFYLWICKVRKGCNSDLKENNMDHYDWKQMYAIYTDLCDAFNLYKKLFEAMILFHAFETFVQSLLLIQSLIWMHQNWEIDDYYLWVALLSATVWIPKNLCLQCIHGVQCDKVYEVIRQTQVECALNLKSECSKNERRMYKNVRRLHRATFSKMRACGLFELDTTLPLRLLGLLTTYTVVLLQFAFNYYHPS